MRLFSYFSLQAIFSPIPLHRTVASLVNHTDLKFRLHTESLQWCLPALLCFWGLNWYPSSSQISSLPAFNPEWHYWLSWVSILPSHTDLSYFLHETMSQFFIISTTMVLSTIFFFQRTLTDTLVAHTCPHPWTLLPPYILNPSPHSDQDFLTCQLLSPQHPPHPILWLTDTFHS